MVVGVTTRVVEDTRGVVVTDVVARGRGVVPGPAVVAVLAPRVDPEVDADVEWDLDEVVTRSELAVEPVVEPGDRPSPRSVVVVSAATTVVVVSAAAHHSADPNAAKTSFDRLPGGSMTVMTCMLTSAGSPS